MSGQLLTEARLFVEQIINSGGFEQDITFSYKGITKVVKGIAPTHHMQFDSNGQPIDSKKSSVTIYLKNLVDSGYPVLLNDKVNFQNHLISFIDSTGISKTYVGKQNHFDNTLGHITIILGEYAS